ncbi:MAG: YggT family protein [Candidatus Omnitrophota bacterium]|nr:YggT family protein [Candidatus Omnitrophota bacterium]
MIVLGNLLEAVATILDKVLWLYSLVVMMAVLVSWVSPDPFNPIVQALRSVTEPLFGWIRRRLPFAVVGMIDLSPLIALVLIQLVQMVIVRSLFEYGVRLR